MPLLYLLHCFAVRVVSKSNFYPKIQLGMHVGHLDVFLIKQVWFLGFKILTVPSLHTIHYASHIVGFSKSRRGMNQISVLQSFTVVKTTTARLHHYEASIVIRSVISRFFPPLPQIHFKFWRQGCPHTQITKIHGLKALREPKIFQLESDRRSDARPFLHD